MVDEFKEKLETGEFRCQGSMKESWHRSQCKNPGKFEFEGKHYCGNHNPQRAIDRNNERHERIMRTLAVRDRASQHKKEMQEKTMKFLKDNNAPEDVIHFAEWGY